MKTRPDVICCNCMFFEPIQQNGNITIGDCRLKGPSRDERGMGAFPRMISNEWCAEFDREDEQPKGEA